MSVKYRVGDVTAPVERPAMIAHVVNDLGRWGSGVVLAISRRWSGPEAVYRKTYAAAGLILGSVQTVRVDDQLWVANMVAQRGLRSSVEPVPVRYKALATCLRHAADLSILYGATAFMPRVGCGRGGGSWDAVGSLVEVAFRDAPAVVCDFEEP